MTRPVRGPLNPTATDHSPTPTFRIPPSPCRTFRVPGRFADSDRWKQWLTTSPRSVADRTGVLAYQTSVLNALPRNSGAPIADLFAATTGTDSDWVVKLIDVASRSPPRIMCSRRDTASWCRSNSAGSHCTIAIRRLTSGTSSSPNLRTMSKPHSPSFALPARPVRCGCRSPNRLRI